MFDDGSSIVDKLIRGDPYISEAFDVDEHCGAIVTTYFLTPVEPWSKIARTADVISHGDLMRRRDIGHSPDEIARRARGPHLNEKWWPAKVHPSDTLRRRYTILHGIRLPCVHPRHDVFFRLYMLREDRARLRKKIDDKQMFIGKIVDARKRTLPFL